MTSVMEVDSEGNSAQTTHSRSAARFAIAFQGQLAMTSALVPRPYWRSWGPFRAHSGNGACTNAAAPPAVTATQTTPASAQVSKAVRRAVAGFSNRRSNQGPTDAP